MRITLILIAAFAVLVSACAVSSPEKNNHPLTIGWAQIRPEEDFVYVRIRAASDKKKTPYGLFAFDRRREKWVTVGDASNFSKPALFGGGIISPESFFYTKQGYNEVPYGNYKYSISADGQRVVITAKSGAGANVFKSGEVASESAGTREYQFKHISGTQLWFDMRVLTDSSLFSDGIGFFDTKDSTFHVFNTQEAGIRTGSTVITRITGAGKNVYVAISYCGVESCLDDGAVVLFRDNAAGPQVSGGKGSPLPHGGIVDISTDGDFLWVVASTGISRWKPGTDDAVNFTLPPVLETIADVPSKSCGDCPEDGASSVPEGEILQITGFTGDGFLTGTDGKIWIPASAASLAIK